jgi:hypothetical protein
MVIVLVIDRYDQLNNGTTMTAYRFAKMLEKRGHEVRVVAVGDPSVNPYAVQEFKSPVSPIAHSQGFLFAKPDKAVFKKAFAGADLVHFLLPLPFEKSAYKYLRQMDIPMSAAFHLQPENITFITHTDWCPALARGIYKFFNWYFYQYFTHIHCPSRFIADQLKINGYAAKTHVISNGVDDDFVPATERQKHQDGLFHILMIGRLSPEKRQKVLIDAIRHSKFADKIQLHLAGNGPCKKKLMEQGKGLKHQPTFGFYSKEELIQLIHACDLYVHASVIEIEAISCMEAFSCGLVPVICDSDRSATPQFAIDDRSLFKPDDSKDLAQKIDYWITHPMERERMSKEYASQGDRYRVEQSILEAEKMFQEVITEHAAAKARQ